MAKGNLARLKNRAKGARTIASKAKEEIDKSGDGLTRETDILDDEREYFEDIDEKNDDDY
ncbi:MAG: hypothetical protein WAW80_00395 [Candidatus Saccharimonadales bacterium]